MQLQQISLQNYRGFKNIELDFQGKSTVLYGINGVGKSSILRGINLLFARAVSKVVMSEFKQTVPISRDDVYFGTSRASIHGSFVFDNRESYPYGFLFDKTTGKRQINRKVISDFSEAFSALYLSENSALPVFAYYGVNRSVLDVPLRIRKRHEFGKLEAYQNALKATTDFRTFFEWFRNQQEIENSKARELGDFHYHSPALEATKTAIASMLPGLENIRIAHSPLRMCATKGGQTLTIQQLSDGEKCALAMLGDLARRLSLANPGCSNPLLGGGIVLIDEVELHMHPSWQQSIVPTLHRVFPNIQFIITTHSPVVLGGLNDDFKILKLTRQDDARLQVEEMRPAFYDANLILEDRMDTPSIPPEVSEVERALFQSMEKRDFASTRAYLTQLAKMTNGSHPSITKAQILLHRLGVQPGEDA